MHLEIGENKMIEKLLKDWKGSIDINNKHYNSVQDAVSVFKTLSDDTCIVLHSANENVNKSKIEHVESKSEYRITVKKYMTEQSTLDFDFMAKWNNDIPMPLRTMTGTIEKETRGMVYMKLHGQAEPVIRCMRCGRLLTNEVSKMYGIGPECITKIPMLIDFAVTDVDNIKKNLVNVTWEGWIIKSAIVEKEEL